MSNAGQLDLPVNVRPRRLRSLEHGWSLIHCRFRGTERIEVARRLHLAGGTPFVFHLPQHKRGCPPLSQARKCKDEGEPPALSQI